MAVVKLNNPSVVDNEAAKQQPNADTLTLLFEEIKAIRRSLGASTGGTGAGLLIGTLVKDYASLASAAQDITGVVTVTGAALGDLVVGVSAALDLQGMQLTGYVSSANTVTLVLRNGTGGAIDLASQTFTAFVMPSANLKALAAMTMTS